MHLRLGTLRVAFVLPLLVAALGCGSTGAPSPIATPSGNPQASPPPPVPQAWADWITRNEHPIRSTDPNDRDFSDLQFLKPLLDGRRIVQLGESGHGVGEFDAVKARVIEFLHEEMGYDVIAFESGMFECFHADEQAAQAAPIETMKRSIFQVWHAQQTLPLFEYLKATKATARPLVLAGFDTQISGAGIVDRPAVFAEVVGSVDAAYAQEVRDLDQGFVDASRKNYAQFKAYVASEGDRLTASYDRLTAFFDDHAAALDRIYRTRPLLPKVLRQVAWSVPRYIAQLRADGLPGRTIRDAGMAVNVGALADALFPDKKIIVWAHNYHIQHDAPSVYGMSPADRTMGGWLVERYEPQLYTVGLFMYEGQAAQNNRTIYSVTAAQPGSLEALFARTTPPASFVDMLHESRSDGTEWMFTAIPFKDWGDQDMTMVPRDQFDAILFVRTVRPPSYI